jgi:hypothetical protein
MRALKDVKYSFLRASKGKRVPDGYLLCWQSNVQRCKKQSGLSGVVWPAKLSICIKLFKIFSKFNSNNLLFYFYFISHFWKTSYIKLSKYFSILIIFFFISFDTNQFNCENIKFSYQKQFHHNWLST